jgi:hypothetical protein
VPHEKPREAGFGAHAPRPFIRYLLLGLLVAGLVLSLLAYGKGTFLKAGWKKVNWTVAQAYETWWSLSQAPSGEEDSDVVPANYQEDAQTARQKAIQVYERFLQSASQTQRRYYCSGGD